METADVSLFFCTPSRTMEAVNACVKHVADMLDNLWIDQANQTRPPMRAVLTGLDPWLRSYW